MTLYLWHLTAMVGLIGLLAVLGGPGLGVAGRHHGLVAYSSALVSRL